MHLDRFTPEAADSRLPRTAGLVRQRGCTRHRPIEESAPARLPRTRALASRKFQTGPMFAQTPPGTSVAICDGGHPRWPCFRFRAP
jgi:hypothetical protein